MSLKEKMDKYEKQFGELIAKCKECDEKVQQLQVARAQLWDEANIVKGRYNELKEIDSESGKDVNIPGSNAPAGNASGNGSEKGESGRILEGAFKRS